jgi:hypothetical protein
MIRIAPLALAAALLWAPGARAQTAIQKCSPTNTTHTAVVRLPGITVGEQTCVIRFGPVGRFKAWVHTEWRRTSFRTRFAHYAVSARLELRNVVDNHVSTKCRHFAHTINTSRTGGLTCETSPLEFSQAKGWSGDGAISYRTHGGKTHVHQLRGSPAV